MNISFEFFPPRTEKGHNNLKKVREELNKFNPEYFSVTFGAGGVTQESTFSTVLDIKNNDKTPVAPHISCIGSDKKNILDLLNKYKDSGINRLVTLRGDMPSGMMNIGDFNYANELVEFIRNETGNYFDISVAAYPEFHSESKNPKMDITNFVNKVKAGANRAITQYFYNTDSYFKFVEDVAKHGLNVNIVPGIMPITNYVGLVRFSSSCGTEIPKWILSRLDQYKNDIQSINDFGFDVVSSLCLKLKDNGVNDFHFYTMNKTEPSLLIGKSIGA